LARRRMEKSGGGLFFLSGLGARLSKARPLC